MGRLAGWEVAQVGRTRSLLQLKGETRTIAASRNINELGHEGGGHVDEGYYRCLCEIGAKLALTEPGVVLGE
jgi:hypothetical protein